MEQPSSLPRAVSNDSLVYEAKITVTRALDFRGTIDICAGVRVVQQGACSHLNQGTWTPTVIG